LFSTTLPAGLLADSDRCVDLVVFPHGLEKEESDPETYPGEIESAALVEWLNEAIPDFVMPLKVAPARYSVARHIIGCHFTQETRVQTRVDDVAGDICQALPKGQAGGQLPAAERDEAQVCALLRQGRRARAVQGRGVIHIKHSTDVGPTNRSRASM